MAHHSKFLSVNLNSSYGRTSSSSSSTSGYGNGRPRSAGGGGGGMVVLSRPRSSSGAAAHKSASRLAVPAPVNLPSLRKEHERLDPASSRPSSGHSGSGLGPGHGSSMGWTKPAPPMKDFNDKDGGTRALSSEEQRSITGASRSPFFMEKTVILRGEDFPSLLAISASSSKQKQRHISEKSDAWGEKAELPTLLDMRPRPRSSPLINGNVQGSDGGASRIPYSRGQSRQEDANFPGPLPSVRLRHTSDWDDDERDRSHGFSAFDDRDGRSLLDGEARSSLSWDSGRGDLHGREFMTSRKEDRVVSSWRVTVQPNRDLSTSRALHVDRDHVGHRNLSVSRGTSKDSSHARLFYGDRREFGSGVGIGNAELVEDSNDRAEVSNNRQRGKPFSSGMNSKGPTSSGVKGFISNDPVLNFSKEKLTSIVGKSYTEDANWGGMGSLSSDSLLDSKAKIFRKKKEAMNSTDFFDPVRESFEAELERVQQLQERERQQVMEEQARAMEVARREAEERERIAREEEERRRLLEEEVREAAWRADQEKLEAARRIEEQKIAIKEEKRRILMEEERRKEAARQKLLELEARIAKRHTEANTKDDRIEERDPSRSSELAEWEKTERTLEPFTISPSSDSSFINRLSEAAGFMTHTSNVENYLFAQRGRPENNCIQNNDLIFKFQDQDGGYPSSRHDAFSSKRGFLRKQFQGSDGPMPVAPSFKKGMSPIQTETGLNWDRNSDCDQFNGSSNIDVPFQGWDHGHFDGSQLAPYSQRSLQNSEVEDLVSFSRVRHTLRQPRVPPPPSLSRSQRKNSFGAASEGPNSSLSVNSDAQSNPTGRKEDSDVQIMYNCGYQQIIPEPRTTELLEGAASSLLQTENKSSPKYDSQSSLSVSSPPSSPTQHSPDELDDCEGSPALTSIEEENMIFSDRKHMLTELDAGHMDSEIIPFSHEEDDEWAVDNNEEMQGEEDHHEVHDIYQEDNKVHEGNPGNLQMENNLDDVDIVVEKRDEEMRHSSYGINVCSQLGASGNDVLNKDFGHAEKTSMNQGNPTDDATADLVFANNSADSLQSKDAFTDEVINSTSEEKTDERQEDAILGAITTADHSPEIIGASKKSGQHPMASAAGLPLSSSLCSVSTPVLTSQDEMPVRLQFGLFSGPPLIPSPLPTIQIGSIQMPLPLHEQIDSYAQMHPSQSPLFQFGQINRYTPPISQSSLPISAQTMSLAHSSINQNPSSSSSNLVSQGSTSIKILKKGQRSFPADNQPGFVSEIVNPCPENLDSQQLTALLDVSREKVRKSQNQITSAASDEKKDVCNLLSPSANPDVASNKNFRSMVNSRRVWVRPHVESLSSNRKSEVISKAPGTMPGIRGNRFTYNARNTGSLPSLRRTENSFANSYRHQRRVKRHFQGTEYRVKENDGARQMQCTENFNHSRQNEKPNSGNIVVGVSSRNSGRKEPAISKSTKLTDEDAAPGAQVVGADSNMSRPSKNKTMPKMSMATSGNFRGEGILKKNGLLEDDIDAPLQSGIVRIFNQPGIEASADGDGFVEVRSKRKMSNERRGQRERETNPKYMIVKVPRSHSSTLSNNRVSSRSDMVATSAGGAAAKSVHSDPASAIRRSQANLEASLLPTTDVASQTIPPIGTPAMNFTDCDANFKSLKSTQLGSDTDKASDGAKLTPSLSFGNNITAYDKASVPLGTWGTVHLNQQAITSTLSQLDEPSNPVESNPLVADKISLDDSKHATSTHEKPSFSSTNQLNFPFAGEKIQFGAVALPPTLPSSTESVSSGIWPPGSVILDASIIHNVPVHENSRSCFFDKEKCSGESCTHLDDTEAEAEAAASAVAVAAISNDEIHVSTLGTGSTSDNGTKGLGTPGVTRFVDVAGQSAIEESLVVTLPADLSVDTPHTLWPPLPNIQSSRAMLSHITGPQPSPFPFFDPNPILGGPIFAFRPQDESTGPQAQPQQNAAFGSVPTGTWSQCHSGADSFYGSPAGFPAPFISPPGGLSGVHGHPQMVFYNHFAPVGQFGQVGLSYMGTTYIPTGEQPDWKHNSEAPTVNSNKPDPSNLNVVYGQQKVVHVPTPAQQLSTGSAVIPVTSPFPMFNLRPFQSSTETSVPAHWPPTPHPSTHSIRLSTASEQQQSLPLNEPHSAAADFPYELGLSADARTIQPSRKPQAGSIVSLSEGSGIGMVNSFSIQNMITPQSSQQTISPAQQHLGPIGKADQPKGAAPKTSSGSEWRRRSPFPGKHCNAGTDKNIGVSTKLKQIYVPKSLSTGHATSS